MMSLLGERVGRAKGRREGGGGRAEEGGQRRESRGEGGLRRGRVEEREG